MKVTEVKELAIPEVKVIRFARFCDGRGYFTEIFRRSDFKNHIRMEFFKRIEFVQGNESFSKTGTIRGLHFQWSPPMGKLVRTIQGRMIDLVLDIRKYSPTFGKMIAYEMPCQPQREYAEWIWVPPGFAHGNLFSEDTTIEYLCTGEYNPECEAGISPLAADIDWEICERDLREEFKAMCSSPIMIMSEKDRSAPNLTEWRKDQRSSHF